MYRRSRVSIEKIDVVVSKRDKTGLCFVGSVDMYAVRPSDHRLVFE